MTSNTRLTAQLSIDLIAGSQTVAGAYPASPAHEVYRHGWLRDGSWCAYAMDRAGKPASAAAWHRWVANTLLRQEHRVDEALAAVQAGTIDGRTMLPARFTLDGDEEPPGQEEWPNFQLDCYGFGCGPSLTTSTAGDGSIPRLSAQRVWSCATYSARPRCPVTTAGRSILATATPRHWRRSPPGCATSAPCSTMPKHRTMASICGGDC